MSDYTPTNWISDDVVSASRMNKLEQAIGELNMSYTPNIWKDGDVLTAAKMNALEQAVASGGGGGGSSDFSTATVTLNQEAIIYGSFVRDGIIYMDNNNYTSCTLVIGENGAAIEVLGTVSSVSGDITGYDGVYFVTGDCTITIS